MQALSGWINSYDFPSPDGEIVETKIDDTKGCRNVQLLKRQGRSWFDGEMYVYYTPTHWRPIAGGTTDGK